MSNTNFIKIIKLNEIDLKNIKVTIFQIRFFFYEKKIFFN